MLKSPQLDRSLELAVFKPSLKVNWIWYVHHDRALTQLKDCDIYKESLGQDYWQI